MTRDSELARALAITLDGIPPAELAQASAQLRQRYRSSEAGGSAGTADRHPSEAGGSGDTADRRPSGAVGVTSEAGALAYLATRLPATAEATGRALAEAARLMPPLAPATQLDLGAGAGAAAWAAREVWPSIAQVTLIDHDRRMIELGQRLAAAGGETAPAARWNWRTSGITGGEFPPADVVTASYVLGELDLLSALEVAEAAWKAARKLLVVVGPGTPAGFERIREVRDRLLAAGAAIVAPCPHADRCPIQEPDWCHFAARVARSQLHRTLKSGRLGYEDEKFSYVAVSPARETTSVDARVLRRPVLRRKLVELELCCADGRIRTVRVGHSKASYRSARSLRWGDATPPGVI